MPYRKGAFAMSVQQFHGSHSIVADNSCNARERQLQFFGLRKNRLKQSALQGSRASGLRRQMNLHDGRSRRMRLQIKLQQFEKHIRVQHGRRQSQRASELSGASESADEG